MAQTVDTPPEISTENDPVSALRDFHEESVQEKLESPVIARIGEDILHYAATPRVAVKRRAPSVLKRRGSRIDWYEVGVIALILTSAAVCIGRLVWATQP